ncbi:MAG TPA: cation transporter [Sporichthyaceae bacterium]|jgi:divalent metal cation (Fe/Co/Zn/Cd) transporter|nr:cation transporter [Sporichthyaceae bacterium]
MAATCAVDAAVREVRLTRRIRLLVAATISWNLTEVVVALAAGAAASSPALIGFGLDSIVEVASAAAVAWQFATGDRERRAARERVALRVIAVSFLVLACWITLEAVHALTGGEAAKPSLPGLLLAAASLLMMPVLSVAQGRAGRALGSPTAVADARQGMLCSYLSAALLTGLLLNSTLGWSWADPAAALLIAGLAAKEGLDAWRGRSCCAPDPVRAQPSRPKQACACCN